MAGIWKNCDVGLCGALEEEAQKQQWCGGSSGKWDEDADVDEVEEGEEYQEAVQEYRVMERSGTTASLSPLLHFRDCHSSEHLNITFILLINFMLVTALLRYSLFT